MPNGIPKNCRLDTPLKSVTRLSPQLQFSLQYSPLQRNYVLDYSYFLTFSPILLLSLSLSLSRYVALGYGMLTPQILWSTIALYFIDCAAADEEKANKSLPNMMNVRQQVNMETSWDKSYPYFPTSHLATTTGTDSHE